MASNLLSLRSAILISSLAIPSCLVAQTNTGAEQASLTETVKQLQEQVKELRDVVAELRQESERYHNETQALKQELKAAIQEKGTVPNRSAMPTIGQAGNASQGADVQAASSPEENSLVQNPDRVAKLEEEYQLLTGKVDDQYQTKLESASKYRVRLSGIALFNVFGNHGNFASSDSPELAVPQDVFGRSNSFGASVRQSQFGLEVFGPEMGGARTSGEVQFDFAGGFPDIPNGVTLGIMRLRTGTIRLDWPHTTIVVGQDAPFFSALSPTSFATLAEPAMSYSGNLWTWTPQVRVERRFEISERSKFTVQAGVLDPLSGESPYAAYNRTPQAGEFARQPAYAMRTSWAGPVIGQQATIGVSGYIGNQNWGFGRDLRSWAGMIDWNVPFGNRFTWSGEFYRGESLGGLGGGTYRSVLFSGPPLEANSEANGLNTVGGWSQLKVKPWTKWEFNAAVGEDNPFAQEVRTYRYSLYSRYTEIVRNQSGIVNVIYRPRSNLLLSAEYRRIQTYRLDSAKESADHVNLAMGILF